MSKVTIDTELYDEKREPEAVEESEKPRSKFQPSWKNPPTFQEIYQNYVDA